MLIGVFSDVHDNIDNLQRALDVFNDCRVSTLVFCGDFCSAIPVGVMGEGFEGDIHVVFGNNDGDRLQISAVAQGQYPNLKLHGEYAALELDGAKIAVTHYPFYAQALARTGDYQAVFSGHTHEPAEERFGDCLWLSPGEVMGWTGEPTVAIYDTETNTGKIIRLSDN